MRAALPVSLVAGLLIAGPGNLAAQEPSFLIMPKGGVTRQALPFTQQFLLVSSIQRKWKYEMEAAVIYGGVIEAPTPFKSLAVRLEGSKAGKAKIRQVPGSEGPPVHDEVSASVSILSAAAVFQPPRFCWGDVCPRLVGGGGIKKYDFTGNLVWDDIVDRFADDQSHATLQLGVGIVAYVSRLAIVAEVMDFSNGIRFASRDQPTSRTHDLSFSIGAGVAF